MKTRLLDIPAGIPGCIVAAAAFIVVTKLPRSSKLDAIPTVGSSSWLGSWWDGLTFLSNAADVIQQGYKKHKASPFKVAEFYHWLVILSSRKHVEEVRRAPDDELSLDEAINDRLYVKYTMGPQIEHNPYHVPIVRSRLTRNIAVLYPDVKDEVTMAFDDVLDLRGNEWKAVPALSIVQRVVCRISNRVFVGLPLCRNPDWIDLNIRYTIDVAQGALVLKLFPDFLKPMAAWFFTSVHRYNRHGRKLLGPVIKERQKFLDEYGNEWADKPNDFLSWLMEEAEGPESTEEYLTTRILVLNFAAIHTTSSSFAHTLFYLAMNPQYIQPLREEVEGVVDKEGWSKAALGKMQKVDSFVKECQRLEGISSTGLVRKALKDFTFSDGTFIPKGTVLTAAIECIHHDGALYENPHAFEPFRFADMRGEDGDGVKHQLMSTSSEYLPFGHGKHACSGRFFAANELKTMLAHIVVTYDVKLEDEATRPQTLRAGTARVPDPNAKVMFRRRVC